MTSCNLFGRLTSVFFVFVISLQYLGLAVSEIEQNDVADKDRVNIARNMIKAYVGDSKSLGKDMNEISRDIEHLFKGQFPSQVIKDLLDEMLDFANSEDDDLEHQYADRFVRGMLDVVSDPDCMSREFDASDEDLDIEDAILVFQKCKLIVIRNALDLDFLHEYRDDFADYIQGLHQGYISSTGTTTNGEGYFLQQIDHKRWEVLVMGAHADPDLLADENIISILSDPRILGDRLVLHSLGSALAEPGATGQRWHIDDTYLFGTDSFPNKGIGGHDLPSYAATMMVPMLNMTNDHGPTEFCMGSSYINGFNYYGVEIKDNSLRREYNEYLELDQVNACPIKSWRSPQLHFGDVLIFDYQLKHRGGPNHSPDMRAVMYMTYSRRWYKDRNFYQDVEDDEDEGGGEEEDFEYIRAMLIPTRFAIPDGVSDDYYDMDPMTLENIKELFPKMEALQDSENSEYIKSFVLSNKDVDSENLVFSADEFSYEVPSPGNYITVEAKVGSQVFVQSSSDRSIVKAWTVTNNQGQIVLRR